MSEPTDEIDGLLQYLYCDHLPVFEEALTALVAERDALRKRVAEQDADIKALSASNAILHGRLEAPADRDRDLRERLVESALRVAHDTMMTESEAEKLGRQTVWIVNGALAEMRKGGGE